MKKIFQIYLADLKRISTNVVAIVIIMGLGIIPALYAWFNIMSNWDPYGEEATSQMHIAVYSPTLIPSSSEYTAMCICDVASSP